MKDEVSITDDFGWVRVFETGLRLFKAKEWEEAIPYFEKANKLRNNEDSPSIIYINRCREYIICPPNTAIWVNNSCFSLKNGHFF